MKQKLTISLLASWFIVFGTSLTAAEPVVWDTVATSTAWDSGVPTGSGENIALSVSNNGEMGQMGIGGVNLDFTVDGGETGTRPADRIYLRSGSLFLLRHDGDSIVLTTSIAQKDWTSPDMYDSISYDFVPVSPMSSGIYNDGTEDIYDSVFTGRMANRDTSVYVERTVYAPRNMSSTYSNFIVVKSKVFTGTKGAQTGLSIGDVMDWDVPADEPPKNISWSSLAAEVTFMWGTTHPDSTFAWDNSQRFAAEAMISWAIGSELSGDPCANYPTYHGSFGTFQRMMEDERDAQVWWDSIANYDYNSGSGTETDQAIWMTYRHDFSLADSDTLYFWTALATVKQGTISDLEATLAAARDWTSLWLLDCDQGCCIPPTVGDVNQDGVVDIADIALIVWCMWLLPPIDPVPCIPCEAEVDVDYSGVFDITDLSVLIDNQFLTLTPLGPCP